jgi:hypothetical protein
LSQPGRISIATSFGFFCVNASAVASGNATRGRSETPQPICHPRDLTVVHVDFAMFCRR